MENNQLLLVCTAVVIFQHRDERLPTYLPLAKLQPFGPVSVRTSRPLDSKWVVSYWCVIHCDAIFLTVSELYELWHFGPTFLGVGHLGSKWTVTLDSQWVVSYWCVIHCDAIFLTVSVLYGLLVKIHSRQNKKWPPIGHLASKQKKYPRTCVTSFASAAVTIWELIVLRDFGAVVAPLLSGAENFQTLSGPITPKHVYQVSDL